MNQYWGRLFFQIKQPANCTTTAEKFFHSPLLERRGGFVDPRRKREKKTPPQVIF